MLQTINKYYSIEENYARIRVLILAPDDAEGILDNINFSYLQYCLLEDRYNLQDIIEVLESYAEKLPNNCLILADYKSLLLEDDYYSAGWLYNDSGWMEDVPLWGDGGDAIKPVDLDIRNFKKWITEYLNQSMYVPSNDFFDSLLTNPFLKGVFTKEDFSELIE